MNSGSEYRVRDLLDGAGLVEPIPEELAVLPVRGLAYDSRRVEPGYLFFAFIGQKLDGREFAPQALQRGAIAIVASTPRPAHLPGPWIHVRDARRALALASRRFYSHVVERVVLTGITGTNGKTTTAFLLDSILRASGRQTALIGTIEYQVAGKRQQALNTTPESLDIYRILEELVGCGGTHATMEVSSHALAQGRVYQLPFRVGVFTNLTRDHLDFHGTLEAYFEAKSLLFTGREVPPLASAVLNGDDPWVRQVKTPPETNVVWYGLGREATVRARVDSVSSEGTTLTLYWNGQQRQLHTRLLGRPNVYNLLAAFAAARELGIEEAAIFRGIEQCPPIPGRMERVDAGQPFLVLVDYAHTDDALQNLLQTVRQLVPGRVIAVFGCGGDRDRSKRPLMGEVAARHSDFVVVTSDNPRSENPLDIINDILVGLRRVDVEHRVEPDREKAIRIALEQARHGDAVVIAGKGHETYQIVGDQKLPFDDREVARRWLLEWGYGREQA